MSVVNKLQTVIRQMWTGLPIRGNEELSLGSAIENKKKRKTRKLLILFNKDTSDSKYIYNVKIDICFYFK